MRTPAVGGAHSLERFHAVNDIPLVIKALNPDWNNLDKSYWRALFQSVLRSYKTNPQFARQLVNGIRLHRYHYRRPKEKDWTERYADDLPELQEALSKLQREVSNNCVDNIRVANWRKRGDRNRYERQRKSGCCGSCDRTIYIGFLRREYHIGFNYGH